MRMLTTGPAQTPQFDAAGSSGAALPRGPILDWSSFENESAPAMPSVESLPHTAFTTSGRAAIYQALLQLELPAASTVLVPSYHCPTMIAPVFLANFKVAYYGLGTDGLPKLDTIDAATAAASGAIIVAHYFGLPRSLAQVRQWCDQHGIALIEDCAHCYFGQAGARPVGAWGDFSTASLSKFFPLSEGGVLASAHRPIADLRLARPSLRTQLKAGLDVLEHAAQHGRLAGVNRVLALLFRLKNSHLRPAAHARVPSGSPATNMLHECDMARIAQSPLWASMLLKAVLPRGRIIARRRRNYVLYDQHFAVTRSARPLFSLPSASCAPYVFPLWVEDADRVYRALRQQAMPVFRWDRTWPGIPRLDGDVGPIWSHHVLQLLCHQDLSEKDIARTARAVQDLLAANHPGPAALPANP